MQSLFRRKSTEAGETPEAPEPVQPARTKGYTPPKAKETPKRPSAGRQPAGNAKPLTKEESKDRKRQLRQEAAAEYRRDGGPRDRGPERLLARNVVDSRRTVAEFFLPIVLIILLTSLIGVPAVLAASTIITLAAMILLIVDLTILGSRVKREVRKRFPDDPGKGHVLYAITRASQLRRLRLPKPQVKPGTLV